MSLLEAKDGKDPQTPPVTVETSGVAQAPVIKFVKDPQQQVIPSLFGAGYGAYEVRPENFLISLLTHALAIGALLWLLHLTVSPARLTPLNSTPILLGPMPVMPVSKKIAGGGGGGGEVSKLKASAGAPPKATLQQQLAPPVVVAQPKSKLMVTPTIVADMKVPISNQQLGDPLSKLMTPSSGTGVSGGIGNGSGGGVGAGDGRGLGPGSGANFGGGVFKVGNGISAPVAIYQPDPDYSDEARKAKFQGTVILNVIVGTDGRVHSPKVVRSLGMGLDEKAIEKVLVWKFDPAKKDGRPVAVEVNVEVSFNLY